MSRVSCSRLGIAALLLVSLGAAQQPPASPPKPAATAKKHSVKLSWFASSSAVDGYNIYRSTSPNGLFAKINSAPVRELSFVDQDVKSGVHYYYVVRSASGNKESLNSNPADALVP